MLLSQLDFHAEELLVGEREALRGLEAAPVDHQWGLEALPVSERHRLGLHLDHPCSQHQLVSGGALRLLESRAHDLCEALRADRVVATVERPTNGRESNLIARPGSHYERCDPVPLVRAQVRAVERP